MRAIVIGTKSKNNRFGPCLCMKYVIISSRSGEAVVQHTVGPACALRDPFDIVSRGTVQVVQH